MASRTIATILSLRDQFTAPARNIAGSTRNISREVRVTQNQIRRFGQEIGNTAKTAVKDFTKWGTAAAGLAAGFAVKTSLSEAMDLEGFRLTLETVMKDAGKAKELLSWGSDFANATPFETKEITEGIVKLQSYGLTAKEVLPSIGDMASVMGKSLDQAVEAIADGQSGSLERLKEFGISKEMIIKQAEKLRLGIIVNNKGQITDQKKFNKAMFSLMDERFKGGMAKQAGTMKGIWSTITGVSKSALAEIAGITKDGSIKQGSIYETLKQKILIVGDTLTKWQQDGTIAKIATQVTTAVSQMVSILKDVIYSATAVYNFFKNNWGMIVPIITTVVVAITAYKTAMVAQLVYTKAVTLAEFIKNNVTLYGTVGTRAMAIAQWALNAAMKANPIGMVIGGLTLLTTGIIIAYNKSETFRNIVQGLWTKLKDFGAFVLTIPAMVKGIWDGFISSTQALWDKITNLITPLKEAAGWVGKLFGAKDKNIKVTTTNTNEQKTDNSVKYKKYALGGIATKASIFGEAGPEIAIPLNDSKRSKDLLVQADGIINGKNTKGSIPKVTSLTKLNNATSNTVNNNNSNTSNIVNNENSVLNTQKTSNISNNTANKTSNISNQKTSNTDKKEMKFEMIFQGDIYGFDDFKERVSKAIVEVVSQVGSNMAVVK